MKEIFHSYPTINEDDIDVVVRQLKSKQIARGATTLKLENSLKNMFQSGFVRTFSSGKAALVNLLKNFSSHNKSDIFLPTYVCADVYEAIIAAGFNPVLVDIADDYNISINEVKNKITPKTLAVVITHTFGMPAYIKNFKEIAKENEFYIIEDLAHSLGGKKEGQLLGTFGDFAFGSFNATKMLAGGEGGFLSVNNYNAFENLEFFEDNGAYMDDLRASLVINQINKIQTFIEKREQLKNYYMQFFKNSNAFDIPLDQQVVCFRFIIRLSIDFEYLKSSMYKYGIHIRKGVDALLHRKYNINGKFDKAENIFESTVSLPIYPLLDKNDIQYISRTLLSLV